MKPLRASVLPPSFEPAAESGTATVRVDDVEVHYRELTPACIAALGARLREAGGALASRPVEGLIESLGRVGARFATADDPLRARALELLPATARLSRPMAEAVLDGMALDWSADRLRTMVEDELGDVSCLDRFVRQGARRAMALGPRLCVQVVSGSVPGVGVNALLRSLVLKAPTLLKPGWGDIALPSLFAEALAAEDTELGAALAVCYWRGGSVELERAALSVAEVAVAYGSDEAVAVLRAATPVTTRFVGYHHRISVAAIGVAALRADTVAETAAELARAVALFDQRGCVSPQVVWVEEGGEVDVHGFGAALADALSHLESTLPSVPPEPSGAAALQQVRGTVELTANALDTAVWHGGARASWTVVLSSDDDLGLPAAPRAVRVRPLASARGLARALEPWAPHLQTLGVSGFGSRLDALAGACGRVGVSRVVPLASVAFPPAWWRHDGRGPLTELLRWVETE